MSADCYFERKTLIKGTIVHDDDLDANILIYCQSGQVNISSPLFQNETLCQNEVMFIPKSCDHTVTAFSDALLLIHKFNNTICHDDKCILSFLYINRHISRGKYRRKLTAPNSLQALTSSISFYIENQTYNNELWSLKHKELIWIFTQYFSIEELYFFFHPMIDERVPFKRIVLTHYRKAKNTCELADLCKYGVHTFRRHFKKHFGISVYKWLIQKRAERVKYMLSLPYIPLADIIEEFDFSTSSGLCDFCKTHLGDSPTNIRKSIIESGLDNK